MFKLTSGPPITGCWLIAVTVLAFTAGSLAPGHAADPPASETTTAVPSSPIWTNVTNGVGGAKWGYAGVTTMAAVPGSRQVIAGVSEQGLWSTIDGGTTWIHLGDADKTPINNRPYQIVWDPKDAKTFWITGSYGHGIFRTDDGGKTFRQLGKLEHVDGIAIDWSDPARKTLLCGLHEQVRSLQLSTDGGETWTKIGDRLPDKTNFTSDPIILDSKTFLINTAGWSPGASWGIYLSEDAGQTWTKVSDSGPGGIALVTNNGTIYWPTLWNGDIVKSSDHGKTWTKLQVPVHGRLVRMPDGALLGVGGDQVYVSKDNARTWTKVGPVLPMHPSGLVYSSGEGAIYVWRSHDTKIPDAIFRLVVGGTV